MGVRFRGQVRWREHWQQWRQRMQAPTLPADERRAVRRIFLPLLGLLLVVTLVTALLPDPAIDAASVRTTERFPHQRILAAIRFVESGDRAEVPDGDGGLAIGPYQIHEVYWADAIARAPQLGGSYQDCRRRDYAERVIEAYMRHYAPDAWRDGDAEVIARLHNGGPGGMQKDATLGYWRKVRARLLP